MLFKLSNIQVTDEMKVYCSVHMQGEPADKVVNSKPLLLMPCRTQDKYVITIKLCIIVTSISYNIITWETSAGSMSRALYLSSRLKAATFLQSYM